jgi:hypothetical protein
MFSLLKQQVIGEKYRIFWGKNTVRPGLRIWTLVRNLIDESFFEMPVLKIYGINIFHCTVWKQEKNKPWANFSKECDYRTSHTQKTNVDQCPNPQAETTIFSQRLIIEFLRPWKVAWSAKNYSNIYKQLFTSFYLCTVFNILRCFAEYNPHSNKFPLLDIVISFCLEMASI